MGSHLARMLSGNGHDITVIDSDQKLLAEVGALADVIVIALQKPHRQPVHDIVSNLVYCGKAADVETVVVDGRLVVENRRLLHIDLPSLYERVGEAVRRITAK